MIIRIGNFLFRYRNSLFPLIYGLLLFNSPPVLNDYRLAAAIGFVVGAMGQLLRAATIGLDYIIRGGRQGRVYAEHLVQGGFFAHCRNPLYVGNGLMMTGVGIASNSSLFIGLAIPFFTFAYWAIIAAEEAFLRKTFGQDFEDYCSRVNRLVPNFSGLSQTLSQMRFNWRRLIAAEYGSAFLWLGATILVILRNVWVSGGLSSARPLFWSLCVLCAIVTLAYVAARFLKKTGRLSTERRD
jgi:protein-S-isoprenylcysteine O-methyltransferase Ste14